MTISTFNSYASVPSLKPVKFGLMASVDIGSSDGMTAKTAFFTDEGKYIEPDAEQNLKSENVKTDTAEDALQNLTALIRQRLADTSLRDLSWDQKELRRMFFFIPDRPKANGHVPVIHNIKVKNGEPLQNLRLDYLPGRLRSVAGHSEEELPNNIRVGSCNVVAVNDMGGGTLAAAGALRRFHPELFKPGMKLLYLMSGGGLGVAKANFVQTYLPSGDTDRRDLHLMLTQAGISPWYEDKNGMHDYEISAAAAPALVRNFVSELPYWQKRKTPGTVSGETVTTYDDATKVYKTLSQRKYQNAARYAVERYIDAIAMLTARSLYEGTTVMVLAGGVAGGVKDFVNNDKSDFLSNDLQTFQNEKLPNLDRYTKFDRVLAGRIWSKLNQKGRDEYLNNQFTIVTDIKVPNNTMGAPYLAEAQQTSTNDLWIVPAKAFEKNPFAGVQ